MKMKLKKLIETDLFEVRKNGKTYEITIERNTKEWNIWINKKGNGFRSFMFGLNKDTEYTEVLNIIQENLALEITIYQEDLREHEEMILKRIMEVKNAQEKKSNINTNGRDPVQ